MLVGDIMSLNIRKMFVYMVIFMTVFVLGCTGNGDSVSGASDVGVVVTEFMFDTPAVYHNEDINLRLVLENQGQKQVTDDTFVFIYGQTISTNDKHWSVVENSLSLEPKTTASDMSSITLEGAWKIPNDEFLPPQPDMGMPGGVATFDVTLTAPELEEGESTPYTFYTRVCYPYKTSMLSTITSSSKEEMRIQQSSSAVENVNTAGPIHINLGGQASIVARGSTIPVVFKITDVGGGFSTTTDIVCESTPDSMDRNKVNISIEVEGIVLDGTSHELYGDTITTDCTKVVKLVNGQAEMRCSIPIDRNQPTREYHIRAIAEYKYYVSSDTKITVDYISE